MTHNAESDATTYTREDMARAWAEGFLFREKAGPLAPLVAGNPYRITSPGADQD